MASGNCSTVQIMVVIRDKPRGSPSHDTTPSPLRRITVAATVTPPARTSIASCSVYCFHQGLVSSTSYAAFNAALSAPKMLEPDQAAVNKPNESKPGAPFEKMTVSTVFPSKLATSPGSSAAILLLNCAITVCLSATRLSRAAKKSNSGKSAKKKLYAICAAYTLTLS